MATLTIADLDNGKRDLETVDAVANSSEDTTITRYGDSVLTLAGALRRLGYKAPVDYAAGLNVDSALFTVSHDGVIYAPDPSLVPFTTGAWNAAQWRPVQNTANTNQIYQFPTLPAAQDAAPTLPTGSAVIVEGVSRGLVTGGVYVKTSGVPADTVESYAELDAYAGKNTILRVTDSRTEGVFLLSPPDPSVSPDGGITRRLTDGRIARRQYFGPAMLRWWVDPASSDASVGIQAAFNSGAMFFDGEGATFNIKDVNGSWPLDLKNANFKKIAGSVDQINCLSWESMSATAPVHHLSFENVHIDGNRVDERSIVALIENGGRSGFRFRGYVEHVRMKNCSSTNCGTDGVIMFAGALPGAKWPAFEDFVFEDCDFSGNRRHGLSYDTVRGLSMIRTKCKNNGNDLAGGPFAWDDGRAGSSHTDTAGLLYGNGVDGESYGAGNHSQGLLFEDCDMTGNARGGMLMLESDLTAADTGYTPWSDIKIIRGNYDAGLHSLDGSVISILRNGASTEVTNPLRSFESLLIDEPYIIGPSARIIVARASGAIKLSRTRDAYSTLEQLSVLRYSNIDLQIRATDTFFRDATSQVRVSRYLRLASSDLAIPSVSGGDWTVGTQNTTRVGNATGVSLFAITADITTGGNGSSTITINTGGFERCVISGLTVFNAGGAPVATGFKAFAYSKTAISLTVYVASPPTTGKVELLLAAFDF